MGTLQYINFSESIKTIKARLRIDHTCCLKLILSYGEFFVKLDKKDKGKTKAALPTKISPSRIELTPTDFPGLRRKINKNKAKLPQHLPKGNTLIFH